MYKSIKYQETMLDGWIFLGSLDRVKQLFSFPNDPTDQDLDATVLHWVNLILDRDNMVDKGFVSYIVHRGETQVWLHIRAPHSEMQSLLEYQKRIPMFLSHGKAATQVITQLKTEHTEWPPGLDPPADNDVWDPQKTGKWRFFMPWGMAMINQKSLNFFHYPPLRLLEGTQDYLDDPVPVRLKELMAANGATTDAEQNLFSTVMDGAPIAAPDNQGTQYIPNQPPVHLIPIQHFVDYQLAQITLLLNTSKVDPGYTVPMVVYGTPARDQFQRIFGQELKSLETLTIEIQPGLKTHVIGSNHPYAFYAIIQTEVGSGKINPANCESGVQMMIKDLVVAGWQLSMAADPTQDPAAVVTNLTTYWNDPAQAAKVCQLVQHEASLYYPDPDNLAEFQFNVSMEAAATFCGNNSNNACAQ